MDFELTPSPDVAASAGEPASGAAAEFRVSGQPLVIAREAEERSDDRLSSGLPRSYQSQTLCLMARDPRTLFAYWDIDWDTAFRDGTPPDRKVHLRVLNADGSEETTVEVEPLAANCYVNVPQAAASYSGELGWFQASGAWAPLATSEPATTPADGSVEAGPMELATIPFHLTFQKMLDLLRVPKHENGSLVARLADLRVAVSSPADEANVTETEREVVRAIEHAVHESRASLFSHDDPEHPISIWSDETIARALGFAASSPGNGFGGSSRGG